MKSISLHSKPFRTSELTNLSKILHYTKGKWYKQSIPLNRVKWDKAKFIFCDELIKTKNCWIRKVIDLIFSERNKNICICKYDINKCFFQRRPTMAIIYYLHYIVYNTYIIFVGIVFIQVRGIPMGGYSSSPIADLIFFNSLQYFNMFILSNYQWLE